MSRWKTYKFCWDFEVHIQWTLYYRCKWLWSDATDAGHMAMTTWCTCWITNTVCYIEHTCLTLTQLVCSRTVCLSDQCQTEEMLNLWELYSQDWYCACIYRSKYSMTWMCAIYDFLFFISSFKLQWKWLQNSKILWRISCFYLCGSP